MAATGMEARAMDDCTDPEEGVVEMLAPWLNVSGDDEHPAVVPSSSSSSPSTLKSRALPSIIVASLAGLLLLAAYRQFAGPKHKVAGAIEDAEQLQIVEMGATTCPGTLDIWGLGQTAIINTKPDSETTAAHQIEVQGDTVVAHLDGRAYFGDQCVENTYDNNYYTAFNLLGSTLKYTIDLAGAGCGCNAAVYLVSMKQNTQVSDCGDYYCDANSVCGVSCTEVDIMEANMYAWRTTLHTADDRSGQGVGYGGTGELQSSWGDGQYGPGGSCIDTSRPFQVAVSFPLTADNTLQGIKVTLSQEGSPCPLSSMISTYQANGRDGMPEVSKALLDGMTPVVSFWSADSMGWLDGKGPKGGACEEDHADQCPDSVKVYGFSFEKGAAGSAPSTAMPAQAAAAIASANTPAPAPEVNDPDWAIYPGKDTFSFLDVHHMSAADLGACKVYALTHRVDAFVVWRGDCYFRSQSGPECQQHLKDSSEATAYISRSSLAPAPEAAVDLVPEAALPPGWHVAASDNGETYYYNTATGQATWSLPPQ